jgi:hypothetical protein
MGIFSIVIDTDGQPFIESGRAGGNAICEIHIESENVPFPSISWRDFPIIILAWWIRGYVAIAGTAGSVGNSFMNGPYEFVSTVDQGKVAICMRRRTRTNDVEVGNTLIISERSYRNELIRAAKLLLNAVDRYAISGPDVDNLRVELNAIIAL